MRSGQKAAKGSTRREELLRLAARIFAERGYATTTTRDIADEANILSGSLYHHFDTKESMLDEILRPYFAGLESIIAEVDSTDEPALEKARRLILETHQLSVKYQHAALIYSHDGVILRPMFPYIVEITDRLEQLWLRIIRSGVADGSFTSEIDPGIIYRTVIGATSYATQWFRSDGGFTIEEIAEFQIRMLLDGLRSR